METFEIREQFYLNGQPFRIISGAVHYFRTVPQYWRDRLEKLRNLGCNTVETYIPWNLHEPRQKEFCFEGLADIEGFLTIAQELGLYIILRPSPYICSEWEFGGLPAWLLKDRSMRLRCSYGPFQEAVRAYYEVLIPKLTPYQVDRGGSVILMQLENEYGYYGNDTRYLEFLRDTLRDLGVTVPFVTSDGPWNETVFRSGMVEGALPTGNFGSGAGEHFPRMRCIMGEKKPLMCMEFWNGWFDAWGDQRHHTTSAAESARELEDVLREGSVNLYMLEGGTNFGFMSGRNSGNLTPDVTSYDYDAPLTEDGRITEKYEAFRDVIAAYTAVTPVSLSHSICRRSFGEIPCTGKVDMFSVLEEISQPEKNLWPLTMEDVDSYYGYILYRIRSRATVSDIRLEGAADRVQAFGDGKPLFTAFGQELETKFTLEEELSAPVIDLLCENLSRENFGTDLDNQRKGIRGGVRINDVRHYGFLIYPLALEESQLAKLDFSLGWQERVPAFYRFDFQVETPGDTFLDMEGFGKGCAFLNGFNLGRFWDIGPQRRLYIPGPLMKEGENTIVIFETEGKWADSITLTDKPDLG